MQAPPQTNKRHCEEDNKIMHIRRFDKMMQICFHETAEPGKTVATCNCVTTDLQRKAEAGTHSQHHTNLCGAAKK